MIFHSLLQINELKIYTLLRTILIYYNRIVSYRSISKIDIRNQLVTYICGNSILYQNFRFQVYNS